MPSSKIVEYFESFYKGIDDVELTLDEIQHALRRAAVNKKALQKYLELVKEIPEVLEVRYDQDYDIVTAIFSEAEPHSGKAWHRLLRVELDASGHVNPVTLDFRLVNCHGRALDGGFYNRIGGEPVWTR